MCKRVLELSINFVYIEAFTMLVLTLNFFCHILFPGTVFGYQKVLIFSEKLLMIGSSRWFCLLNTDV